MGVNSICSAFLRSLGNCRWGRWHVGGSWKCPGDGGGRQGGQDAALQTAWPGSHRAVCAFLALLTPPYGSRWRLVAPPGRPETASSALGGGESKAERVIIDSPAPGRPKPVPSIPGHGSEPLVGQSQAEAAWGRSVGEGQSAVACAATPALQKSLWFLSWRPPLDE